MVDVRAETTFRELIAAIKEVDPKLATALRRRLRRAGDETVADMRGVVQAGPGSGRIGIRTGIASGIKTTVATGKRRQGVRIQASASALPAGRKPMLRLQNKASFRHPVFGRTANKWVVQKGGPFFGSTIRRHEDQMRAAVLEALNDAVKELE